LLSSVFARLEPGVRAFLFSRFVAEWLLTQDDGERIPPLGRTGFRVPAWLFFWAPKRVETVRATFL
jgi:hypothetical protein